MSSEKTNVILIYGLVALLSVVLIFSFIPRFNISIETSQIVLVLIIVVLLLFPYFKVIEIPGFLKLSKEIEHIRNETKEIKQAQMNLMQAFTISQSATASSHIHLHPAVNEAMKDAAEEAETLLGELPSVVPTPSLSARARAIIESETDRIRQYAQRREYIAAFALMRSHIENLVKDILDAGPNETRNFHQLFHEAKKRELIRPPLVQSILSVRRYANLVIHMPLSDERKMSPAEVDKIVDLGIRTIEELETIKRTRKK